MALTDAFYNAVRSGNVRRVRIMMRDSLLVDTTFAEYEAMEKVVASMKNLYDEHDGKKFIEDRNLWNDDYMNKVMVKVISNFSHERIEHLKEVVRYLRPVTRNVPTGIEQVNNHNYKSYKRTSYKEEKRRCQEQGDYSGSKYYTGVTAGAALGAVVTIALGASKVVILGGVIVGAVAGGVVSTLITKENKNNE